MSVQVRDLILAVNPCSRGFAYVFMEGPNSPFEWGVKEVNAKEKHKNTKTIDELKKLIDRHQPQVLIIEDTEDPKSRRTKRIRKLYRMIAHLAATEFLDLHCFKKCEVEECFAAVGAKTKHEIAKAIALQLPGFGHRVPPFRKAWMSEDPRSRLFDAAALALVFYRLTHGPDTQP